MSSLSPELIKAVEDRIAHGFSNEEIRSELAAAGYPDHTITEVLALVAVPIAEVQPVVVAPVTDQVTPVSNGKLIGFNATLSAGWRLFKSKWTLFVKIALIGIIFMAVLFGLIATSFGMILFEDAGLASGLPMLVMSGVGIATLVVMSLLKFITVRNLVTPGESFGGSVDNSFAKILPIIIVAVCSLATAQAGYFIFIIPGLIIYGYVLFSNFILATSPIGGVQAMIKSTELVRGYWWSIMLRLLYAGLIILLAFIGFGIVASILGGSLLMISNSLMGGVILPILIVALYFVMLVMAYGYTACVTTVLFESLQKNSAKRQFGNGMTWFLRILYTIVPVGFIILLSIGIFVGSIESNRSSNSINTPSGIPSIEMNYKNQLQDLR